MRLVFAVLADSAISAQDGKFSLLGGDVVSLSAPSYPTLHPTIAFVAKIEFEPSEYGVPVSLHVRATGPNGEEVVNTAPLPFVPLPRPEPVQEIPQSTGLVLQFVGLIFPSPGKYVFRILANDQELGSVPLYLLELDSTDQHADSNAEADQTQTEAEVSQ